MPSRKPPNLTKITSDFERAYNSADKATTRKADAQAKFFEAATRVLESQVRKQKLVNVTELMSGDTFETFIAKQYPGWRLVSITDSGEDAVIEEDPALMKFSFTNKENGKTYQRTVSQSANSIDDERLRKENPKLWEQITEWPEPWFSIMRGCVYFVGHNEDEDVLNKQISDYLETTGLDRMLKDPDTWTDAEFREVSKYMVPGTVSQRLVKPRQATPEELNG